jgi:hypothetical protein
MPAYGIEQLARPQQEVRILGQPETLVADGKRLVDKDAGGVHRRNECRHQWTVEIVRHHYTSEAPALKSKGSFVLEIGLDRLQSVMLGEIGDARELPVDRHNAVAACEKQTCVAPGTACNVENVAPV